MDNFSILDFYDQEFFSEILQDLKISDDYQNLICEQISLGARHYLFFQDRHKNGLTPKQVTKKLQKIDNHLCGLKALWLEAMSDVHLNGYHSGIGGGILGYMEPDKDTKAIIQEIDELSPLVRSPDLLPKLLDYHHFMMNLMIAEEGLFSVSVKFPMVRWLYDMQVVFDKSPIPFTHGKYYPEIGDYKSECLDLLHKIMQPLDPNMDRTKIANAMDAHAKWEKSLKVRKFSSNT